MVQLASRHLGAVLALAVLSCLLAGCSQIREDVGQPLFVDEAQLASANDYHDVLRFFGPPHRLSVSEAGMVFLYEEIDVFERQLGINLTTNSVALFKAVAARGIAERRFLLVFFDQAGSVQAFEYEEGHDAEASGAALQFVFTVAGVVDDDDLSQSPSIHDWGLSLLEADLPVALNRQQRLDTGHGGVQQQATPTAVGQHTLELRNR